jgi:hypothetical protein
LLFARLSVIATPVGDRRDSALATRGASTPRVSRETIRVIRVIRG